MVNLSAAVDAADLIAGDADAFPEGAAEAIRALVNFYVLSPEYAAAQTKERLEYLRGCIRAESISYSELAELQGLAEHIEPGDVELLEWAGVPEFPDDSTERAEYNAHPECRE